MFEGIDTILYDLTRESKIIGEKIPIMWPLQKVKSRQGTVPPTLKGDCVLLMTGALNPIHNSHVSMMDVAKRALEASGKRVLGGFVSPSHAAYVRSKMIRRGERYFGTSARIDMVQIALAGSEWLEAGCWESAQSGFVDFPAVAADLASAVAGEGVAVFYVCGLDHFESCAPHRALLRIAAGRRLGCVVVPRGGGPAPPSTPSTGVERRCQRPALVGRLDGR